MEKFVPPFRIPIYISITFRKSIENTTGRSYYYWKPIP